MAYLSISEHNTTQLVAVLYELDTKYELPGRIATWSCYRIIENSDGTETYELVEEEKTIIEEKASTTAYVFNNLTPSTRYKITVVVSNIHGSNDKTFMITQSTAEEGGIEYPSYKPQIKRFYAKQTQKGIKSIECGITVTSLFSYNERTGALGIVSVTCQNEDGTIIGEADYDSEIFGTEVKDTESFSVPSFGTYTINLKATNIKDAPDQTETLEYKVKSTTTVEVVDDIPNCTLNCTFEDRIYSYENGRVTGTIYNYPVIAVADFNQFCTDINTVRIKYGMPEYGDFITVNSGEEMSYSVFEHLYYAIMAIYINKDGLEWDDSFPSVAPTKSGIAITREFIEGLVSALIKARNYIFNIQEEI